VSRIRHWVVLADVLARAGCADDPEQHAAMLREAGVPVTRDSRARWRAPRGDGRIRAWTVAITAASRDVGEALARHGW
jgi:hypothetical protein